MVPMLLLYLFKISCKIQNVKKYFKIIFLNFTNLFRLYKIDFSVSLGLNNDGDIVYTKNKKKVSNAPVPQKKDKYEMSQTKL